MTDMTDMTIIAIEAEGLACLPFEAGLSGSQQHTPVVNALCLLVNKWVLLAL